MADWLPTLSRIAPWHWWILGAVFLLVELAVPGGIFVWLAAAAFALGLVVFVLPVPAFAQILLFGLLALLSLYVGRRYMLRFQQSSDPGGELLNRRGASYVGRTLVVTEPIRNGVGRVKVGDTVWRARGEDAPEGATVRVIDVDGTTLVVQREN